jgi:TP901 family phage tail tape measure protein
MSEFLATARILVRPDTAGFRAEMLAQLKSVTATAIKIPVIPIVTGGGLAGAAAGTAAFTAAQGQLSAATAGSSAALAAATTIERQYAGAVDLSIIATQAEAAAMEKKAIAVTQATVAQAAHTRTQAGLVKGAVAQSAALFGLRAGTLAASSAFIVGTVAVLGFAKAVQSAAKLATELNVFRVTAGATADEMTRVAETAKRLGRDITLPGVTAGDAAIAMTELAKAGLSVQDSLDGARGVLQLSTAAQIDNVQATQLVAGALNSFALAGTEAVRVADLLTGAAKESQGEISDMGTSLAQASAVSHLFGVSIEDTITLLTELAQAGIQGGRAGTSLRVALLRLVNPPAAAAKVLEELNVQIRDINGNLRPQVFIDIQKALAGYTKSQREAKLATIFGSDAIRAAAIIGAKGAEGFNKTSAAIEEAGLAAQLAAARTSGLEGASLNLSNQISALGLQVGEASQGPLTSLVTVLASITGAAVTAGDAIVGFKKKAEQPSDTKDSFNSFVEGIVKRLNIPIPKQANDLKTNLNSTILGINKDMAASVDQATQLRETIRNIISEGQKTGGDLGLNQTLNVLDLLSEKLKKGGPEAQKFGTEVASIRDKIASGQGLKLFPDDVSSLFPADLLNATTAAKVGKDNRTALQKALADPILGATTSDMMKRITDAITAGGPAVVQATKNVFVSVVNAATEQLAKLGEAFDVATAAGSKTGQLAALQKQAAEQQRIIDAANKAAKAAGAGNAGFATAVKRRREAQHALAGINEQIRGIDSQIASDAQQAASDSKAAADKIVQATTDREQALLTAFGLKRDRQQNAIAAAEATAGLQDDINAQNTLAAIVVKQIAAIKKRISVAGGQAAALVALHAIQISVAKRTDELIQQQKDAKAQQRDALLQGIGLDVDLAQITGNQAAEVKARNRKIKELGVELEKERKLHGKNSVAYKEIRNQIAQETAALNAITKAKKQQNNSFAQASFEFLQTQQGFASSLLGNLIPSAATGGLVGGGAAPVQGALTPVAGAAEARSQSGVTAGQGNTTNSILHRILQQLIVLNGEQKAPEARRQVGGQKSVMDGVGGG